MKKCALTVRPPAVDFSLAQAEKLHIQKVLDYTGNNKAQAARLLKIGIATLYRKLHTYRFI